MTPRVRRKMPDGFAAVAIVSTREELRARYDVRETMLAMWLADLTPAQKRERGKVKLARRLALVEARKRANEGLAFWSPQLDDAGYRAKCVEASAMLCEAMARFRANEAARAAAREERRVA